MVNIVMAGGGTAGHTSPLIATAHRLKEIDKNVIITCVGTPRGLESRVIPAAGLELKMIDPVPFPRTMSLELLQVPVRLQKAVRQSREILRQAKADVVVGFGGYVSMPVYLAARALRVPIVIHEQNAVPGLANRVAARFAERVAVTFPGTDLPQALFLGLPVRREISELDRTSRRSSAQAGFGLSGTHPVLLVSGGSQGAASINKAVREAMPRFLAAGIDVLHVLGPRNLTGDIVQVSDDTTGARYVPVGYVDAMEDAYAAADVMVGRSGAGTVVETAIIGLPTIFVPLPHGNGEQAKNARAVVEAGGAVVVADSELSAQRLLDEALSLLTDDVRRAAMSQAARNLMPRDAAGAFAQLILDVAGRS